MLISEMHHSGNCVKLTAAVMYLTGIWEVSVYSEVFSCLFSVPPGKYRESTSS